jgi:NosR/NirI family transcriptional regulator, nitrous oxide reductase regulator
MKRLVVFLALFAGTYAMTSAQGSVEARLARLFPTATAFSPKEGEPPHYTAFGPNKAVLGYAFNTTEILPLERGYGGPIVMLIGLDPTGHLTGLVVVEHHEPYGDFSIDRPQFAEQFKGKDVRDAFKLGEDVDAVARASITMSSAVRAIRNSSRRMARALLTAQGPPSK